MDPNKKKIAIIATGIIACILVIAGGFFWWNQRDTPEKVVEEFVSKLNEQDYETAYSMISKEAQASYDQAAFVTRNKNVYTGVGASDIAITFTPSDVQDELSYHQTMTLCTGSYEFDNTVKVIKEDGDYKLQWSSNFIFPQLDNTDSVAVSVDSAKRGTIYDRNGMVMAEDGVAMEVGIVPGKLGENKETTLAKLAEILKIEVKEIETELSATWVKDDLFVPIKTIARNEDTKKQLEELSGIQIQSSVARVYPYAEKAAHVTGYVGLISAEELALKKELGYDETTLVGKAGLESAYEETLHGVEGYSIIIKDQNGTEKEEVSSKAVVKGKDVKTTIDMNVQSLAYDELMKENNAGSVTAMNPKTGEVLALVSTPAYDPNVFALGIDNATWNALNENTQTPLQSRFQLSYAPGSTFKAITGAVGLDTKTISADEDLGKVDNWKWQEDKSWGDFYVTTTHEYSEPSNLRNALVYSDNIYFAKLATKIGSETFAKSLDALGFNQAIKFPLPINTSTYGDDSKIEEGTQLADTGYGQGKLLVNPIHLTAMYSAFANKGSIMQPYLVVEEGAESVWLKDAFTATTTDTIWNDLVETMTSFGGTSSSLIYGGKTGTAEVGDEQIGWFSAICADDTKPLSITLMVENTKDKGGSKYVIPMIQNILNQL